MGREITRSAGQPGGVLPSDEYICAVQEDMFCFAYPCGYRYGLAASAPPSARGFIGKILTVLDTVARQRGTPEEAFLQEEGEVGLWTR